MAHKLSIIGRQQNNTGWHQSSQFDVASIQKIKVDGSGKNRSLNAIPSPFARMHLFETAFEMVYHDLINHTSLAGDTYGRIVSDCFDLFELIYYWDAHIKEGVNLTIVTWKSNEEVFSLKQAQRPAHKLLGETLESFIKGEPGFVNFPTCLIIKFNDRVIGGTSPFTGFITSPDTTTINLLKPFSQIAYFSRIIPFEQRKPEIKKYIYDFFETNHFLRESPFTKSIRSFLNFHETENSINHQVNLDLQPFTSTTFELELFGKPLLISTNVGTEFFEKYIVKLNYRLNNDCFLVANSGNVDRNYDYLLPFTKAFLQLYSTDQIADMVSIKEINGGVVEVKIRTKDREIKKVYQSAPLHETDGKVIDLKDINLSINIGIFPFLKITDNTSNNWFNDFYRVMFTVSDLNYNYSNNDFHLAFGKNKHVIENGEVYTISRIDRQILERDKSTIGSTYFGINTNFDFIQIEFPHIEESDVINTIIPKWKEKTIGSKKFEFSVDMGTTSTFIAYTDDVTHQTDPKPLEFGLSEIPVAMLNKPRDYRPDIRAIDRYEYVTADLATSIVAQIQEFIPSIIKRGEKYNFPIRTALYLKKSLQPVEKSVLQNANVSFIYQSKDDARIDDTNQGYQTNLKWNIKTNRDFESSIKVYLEELFHLIRLKILLNDGDPRTAKLCWFSPLSFTEASKRVYTQLWKYYSENILKNSSQDVNNITESEAPCYYLFKNATINNVSSVLTLDIGGGSTDIMYFINNKSVLGTSVHFGANVIWGNGFSSFINEKSNGIYLNLKSAVTENLVHTELKAVNERYCSEENSTAGSDEVINFWISNQKDSKVLDLLNQGDFRLSYLLHLCTLVFHTISLLKSKNHPAPTCIIFSGNGSKYVDLIQDNQTISAIWQYFISRIYGETKNKPQVILPQINRKEATCFGGLYVPGKSGNFEVVNYLGFEKNNESYSKYNEIIKNEDEIFNKIISSFHHFINIFFEMNDAHGLQFRNVFGIHAKLAPIKKYIIESAKENLKLGFLKRLELVDREDQISDSLFYYPMVGLIYKINKLTETDINQLIDKSIIFFNAPEINETFSTSDAENQIKGDSLYSITSENDYPHLGKIEIVGAPHIQLRAITAYQNFLNPACNYDLFPENGQNSIIQVTPGKAILEMNTWKIIEKVKIKFV